MALSQERNLGLPLMNLVRIQGIPILQQLHLEEKLLRTSKDNWCIINDGTNAPAIVMGMSGVPAELLEIESIVRDQVPVIRRFTGGGTVIVDSGTIFVTFICNKDDLSGIQPYPRRIMNWSSDLYKQVFREGGDFHLRENDYVLGDRKFGGNAQYITKNRWVHHTSFLWSYDVRNMAYLKLPSRAPEYRSATGEKRFGNGDKHVIKLNIVTGCSCRKCKFGLAILFIDRLRVQLAHARKHVDFICRLKDHMSRSTFIDRTVEAIGSFFFGKPHCSGSNQYSRYIIHIHHQVTIKRITQRSSWFSARKVMIRVGPDLIIVRHGALNTISGTRSLSFFGKYFCVACSSENWFLVLALEVF